MEWLHQLDGAWALLVVCAFVFIEEVGIPIPVPGDVILITGGYVATTTATGLPLFLGFGYLSAVLGATACYMISRKLGRRVILRHGGKLHITPARLDRADRWMARAGTRTVVIARLLPGTRINASIAAGCLNLPFHRFVPGVLSSSAITVAGFTVLGYTLGDRVTGLLPWVDRVMIGLVAVLALLAGVHWLRRRRRVNQPPTGDPSVRPGWVIFSGSSSSVS